MNCDLHVSTKGRRGGVGRIEQDIAVYSDVEAIPDSDLNSRLDIQVSSRNLRAQVGGLLADRASRDLCGTRICEQRPVLVLRNLRGRSEETRENGEANQPGV